MFVGWFCFWVALGFVGASHRQVVVPYNELGLPMKRRLSGFPVAFNKIQLLLQFRLRNRQKTSPAAKSSAQPAAADYYDEKTGKT